MSSFLVKRDIVETMASRHRELHLSSLARARVLKPGPRASGGRPVVAIVFAVVSLLGSVPTRPQDGPESQEKLGPNVVLIVADYMGYADIGPYGSDDIATPSLDRLAREGVRFTNAYAAAPICSPSRAALLTGRYPQRLGANANLGGSFPGLPASEVTVARMLRDDGYATAMFGKWPVLLEEWKAAYEEWESELPVAR